MHINTRWKKVKVYTRWLSLCSLGISRSGRCYECETPMAPECWLSSRSSLWQTPDCRYGDSKARAWRTSVGSCGTSSVRRSRETPDRQRHIINLTYLFRSFSVWPISLLVGPSVTLGQIARRTGAFSLTNQTNQQSPCRVNVHPVGKLLVPAVSCPSSCSVSRYTGRMIKAADQYGCSASLQSIWAFRRSMRTLPGWVRGLTAQTQRINRYTPGVSEMQTLDSWPSWMFKWVSWRKPQAACCC